MAELDEISRVQSYFSPHLLLVFLIYLARALAILCKLGPKGASDSEARHLWRSGLGALVIIYT